MKTFGSMKNLGLALCGIGGVVMLSGCGAGGGSPMMARNSGSAGLTDSSKSQEMTFGSLTTRVVGTAQVPVTTTSSSTAVTGIAGASITGLTVNRSGAQTIANSKIVYARYISGVGYYLYTANPDGSGVKAINTGNSYSLYPSLSPDGSKVTYNAYDNNSRMQVFVVPVAGGTPVQLTSDTAYNYLPNWSPDGTKIIYHRAPGDGNCYVYTVPSAGGSPTSLWGNVYGSTPSYSPDGSQVVFLRPVSGYFQVFIANTDGSGTVQLTSGSYSADSPSWSKDGRYITYSQGTSSGKPQIFMISVSGGYTTQVTKGGAYAWRPSFSPDGSRIAFVRYEGGNYTLCTISTGGYDQQTVTGADGTYSANWSGFLKSTPTTLIGSGGILGTGAAGFIFARQGDIVSSVLTFDSAAATVASRGAARVAAQTSADSSSPDLVFSVTATDSISALNFANFGTLSPTATPVSVPLSAGIAGALVDFNSYTGKVSAVLPYAATRAVHTGPQVEKKGNLVTYHGSFTAAYNEKGENIAPQGASTVQLDGKTGQLIKVN